MALQHRLKSRISKDVIQLCPECRWQYSSDTPVKCGNSDCGRQGELCDTGTIVVLPSKQVKALDLLVDEGEIQDYSTAATIALFEWLRKMGMFEVVDSVGAKKLKRRSRR